MKKSSKIAVTIILIAILCLAIWALWKWQQNETRDPGKSAYAHTEAILACGPRPPGSDGLNKARAYISKELAKHGWSTMSQSLERETPVGKRTFVNLIARYHPEALSNFEDLKKLPTKGILGAHIDSKLIPELPNFLGADDAASACALVIELAAKLAKENPELAKKLEIVFFDGEEAFGENITPTDGLYGSRAYAITLYDRTTKPSFGIILDMVGHKNLKIAIPLDTPPHLRDSLMRAAKLHGHEDIFGIAKSPIIDDHYYINKAGVPAIDIIGDFSTSHWWHQDGDDIDLISAKSLSISYQVTLTMLRELLGN